jgi:tetratricopeptide (TPR) repeat protein
MALLRHVLICATALALVPAAFAAGGPGRGAGGGGGDSYAAPAQSDFERAEALIKSGAYEDAVPLLRGIIRDNPNEPDSLYYLGFASEKMLNFKTAFELYARAVQADPDHKLAHERLGLLYLRAGDLPGATAQLDELKRICAVLCDERQRLGAKIGEFKELRTKPAGKGPSKTAPSKDDMEDLTTMP